MNKVQHQKTLVDFNKIGKKFSRIHDYKIYLFITLEYVLGWQPTKYAISHTLPKMVIRKKREVSKNHLQQNSL